MAIASVTRPPGPKNPPLLGHLSAFRRDPPAFLLKTARTFGDLAYFKLGPQNLYLASHPDLIRDVLVINQHSFTKSRMLRRAKVLLGEGLLTSEPPVHTRQRRLVQPAFHRQRLANYAETMITYAARTRDQWRAGETRDIAADMMRLTLALVAKTLFNANVDSEAGEIGEALAATLGLFNLVLMPFSELIEKLPVPPVRRFHRARDRLNETIYRIINERRRTADDRGDLLSMLLLAQDEEGSGGMSDEQVRDEALTLFLAGHETTANALTWTWYLLSQHPEEEARFHGELDEVLRGRCPEPEDFGRLPYAEMVFSEALRLYPPAWSMGRMVAKDQTLDGYRLDPGDIILMSPFVTQRDPRFFPDPERFDPQRWLPERKAERPKFSFFPFGGGARVCIGEHFAWMEGVLLLATMGQRWRLRLIPEHPVSYRALLTLRPRYGMKMVLEPRQR